jgi:Na+/H+ antiporter NhaC
MSSPLNTGGPPELRFIGGTIGAVFPFFVFVTGVVIIALSGAPDERGFWPVQILALVTGLVLAKDRRAFSEAVISGMSRKIVMIMISAWMLASIIGVLMVETGFIQALIWAAGRLHVGGAAFTAASFIIACVVSVSTGTSFGTILICGPILYPAGALAGSAPAILAGAILAGATFGDSIAPISDTTIAGALSQKTDIGGTVRSRLKYVLPAGAAALLFYVFFGGRGGAVGAAAASGGGNASGLPMLAVPILIIVLLLKGRHLLEGLLFGLFGGTVLGLSLGIIDWSRLLSLDKTQMRAESFVIEGINRALGISIFTILLLGLIAALEAGGVLSRLVEYASARSRSLRSAESWIVGSVSAAVLLTCHSIVAILTVGEFTRKIGERMGIHPYRRANLLSLSVSTFPFLLPYFIPVILMASTTQPEAGSGIVSVSPLSVGLSNAYSWALIVVVLIALIAGFGRTSNGPAPKKIDPD